MKQTAILLILVLLNTNSFAQCNGRYQTELFNSVNQITVNYSDVYTDSYHEMDIYMPDGDTEINRPVVLYMHGGSFYGGTKTMTDCIDFCTSMAKRGYVAASLNYRLSNIQATLGLSQLKRLDTYTSKRNEIQIEFPQDPCPQRRCSGVS